MAKIVIAGASDCPYFAKVELLADELQINVPNFFVHKIVKTRKDWQTWIKTISNSNKWHVSESPVIWRELVDRGGKGHLIGGPNEFQEYVRAYYNVKINMDSEMMKNVAFENIRFKEEEDKEASEYKALSSPIKICICGASSQAATHLTLLFGKGSILGPHTEISIVYHDQSSELPILKSLQMGTFDLAFPLIRSISITDDIAAAVGESNLVVIFDTVVVDRVLNSDLTSEHSSIENQLLIGRIQDYYENVGSVIEKFAPSDVRVLVVPNPQTPSLVLPLTAIHNTLNRIPRFCVVGLVMNEEQNVRSVLAHKLKVNPSNIHNIVIWGNPRGRKYIDISQACVHKYDGAVVGPEPFSLPVNKMIWDKQWLKSTMHIEIQERYMIKKDEKTTLLAQNKGITVVNTTNLNQDEPKRWLALAHAVAETLRLWLQGDDTNVSGVSVSQESQTTVDAQQTKHHDEYNQLEQPTNSQEKRIHSLLVASEGHYTVPERMVFSLPVSMNPPGYWTVVQDLELTEDDLAQIRECKENIINELKTLYPWMNQNNQDGPVNDKFIESEIKSLLDEFMEKDKITEALALLQSTLSRDDLLDVSKSKELLIRTLEDLQNPGIGMGVAQESEQDNNIEEQNGNNEEEKKEDVENENKENEINQENEKDEE